MLTFGGKKSKDWKLMRKESNWRIDLGMEIIKIQTKINVMENKGKPEKRKKAKIVSLQNLVTDKTDKNEKEGMPEREDVKKHEEIRKVFHQKSWKWTQNSQVHYVKKGMNY